jgi:hypothetical protein
MNYSKPEITSLASASFAIQSIPKSAPSTLDSKDVDYVTANAYEADE